jgi:hypothetical protein
MKLKNYTLKCTEGHEVLPKPGLFTDLDSHFTADYNCSLCSFSGMVIIFDWPGKDDTNNNININSNERK